jgi:hypothetical protein
MTGLSADDIVTETDGLPTFELGYRFDDEDDPSEVTIFDTERGDTTTTWISASVEDAVRLDKIS